MPGGRRGSQAKEPYGVGNDNYSDLSNLGIGGVDRYVTIRTLEHLNVCRRK